METVVEDLEAEADNTITIRTKMTVTDGDISRPIGAAAAVEEDPIKADAVVAEQAAEPAIIDAMITAAPTLKEAVAVEEGVEGEEEATEAEAPTVETEAAVAVAAAVEEVEEEAVTAADRPDTRAWTTTDPAVAMMDRMSIEALAVVVVVAAVVVTMVEEQAMGRSL